MPLEPSRMPPERFGEPKAGEHPQERENAPQRGAGSGLERGAQSLRRASVATA